MSAAPFQPPPRQTQRAVFPHWAFLLASRQDLWDLSCWLGFRHRATNPVCLKQSQFAIQPWPTPPLPAEAFPLPRPHQMPPDLLFYPVFDKRKAPARMSAVQCLALSDAKRFRSTAQARQECRDGFCQAQEGFSIVGLVSDRLQLGTKRLLALT